MRRIAKNSVIDIEALREHLRKMSDAELRKFGQAAGDIELSEAQTEWRRRQEAKSNRRREAPRYTFVAVTKIIDDTSQACILAKTSKLSCKGCYVNTPTPPPVDTSFRLVISRDQGSFETKGKVVYVDEGKGMGVEFVDLTGDQLKTIGSWLPDSSDTSTPSASVV
jgi:hypothetical protein